MVLSALEDGGPREFRIEPPAAWVELLPLEPAPAEEPGAALQRLLLETQLRVGDRSVEKFTRVVTRVLSPTGMDAVSQVQFTFDPTYEQLTIHAVTIHRQGQRLDALVADEVKVIQQEKELERRIYNGTLTAVLFLKDVRVGDTIELAHTISGQNPILDGKFADELFLAWTTPVARIFRRLLYPEARKLFIKNHRTSAQPAISVKDGVRDYRWELRSVPAISLEGGLPPWFDPWPWVQLSSFGSWSDISAWAAGLFTPDENSAADPAPAAAQIEEWKKTWPTDEGRLLAATRFVQDEVRYLGIELGTNSHQPHDPLTVFNQRFGDCKDKSLLLVTLLRRMGIKADPALVSARRRRGAADDHPWPFAFDHAIVRAELEGRMIWIDGTASLERGRFSARAPPRFERALLVRPDATGLIEIPAEGLETPTSDVEEKYEVAASGAASLHVRSRYLGSDAHQMRLWIASETRESLQRHYLNLRAKEDPAVAVTAPIEIVDDADDNRVEIRQHYALKAFWRGASREIVPTSFEDELSPPWTSVRTLPLFIAPRNARHVVELALPRLQQQVEPVEKTVNGPVAKATFRASQAGPLLRAEFTYRTLEEVVEPAAIKPYLDSLEEMRHLGLVLEPPAGLPVLPPGEELDRARARGLLLSGLFFAGLIGFFFVYPAIQRRRSRR